MVEKNSDNSTEEEDTERSSALNSIRVPDLRSSVNDENLFKVKAICKPLGLIFEVNEVISRHEYDLLRVGVMPLLEGFVQSYAKRAQSVHNRSSSVTTAANGNSERFVRLSNDLTKLEFRHNDSANFKLDSTVRVEHILGLKITNQTQNLLKKL